VLEVLGLVREQGWLADRALEVVLRRQKRLYSQERRATAEALYGVVRAQGRLEWQLGHRPSVAELYAASLVGPGGLAIEAAERRLGLPRGTLAPLRDADARIAAIANPVERLSAEGSLPRWLAERLVAEMGLEEARRFSLAVNTRAPLTVRANLLRTTREDLRIRLAEEGVESEPTRLSPWGLTLDGHANAFGLEAFQGGLFEIQDEGSQLIALACGARPGMKVVDACAGAGGKTLAIGAALGGKGRMLALDTDGKKLEELRRRARRAGLTNVEAHQVSEDGSIAWGREGSAQPSPSRGARDPLKAPQFDRVLVDAPCSGLGTLRRNPEARWRLTRATVETFPARQVGLLVTYAPLVAVGGRLIYATCTVARSENDLVIERFLAERDDFVPVPVKEIWGRERAEKLGDGMTLRLSPNRHDTDGFFAAVLRRIR